MLSITVTLTNDLSKQAVAQTIALIFDLLCIKVNGITVFLSFATCCIMNGEKTIGLHFVQ